MIADILTSNSSTMLNDLSICYKRKTTFVFRKYELKGVGEGRKDFTKGPNT